MFSIFRLALTLLLSGGVQAYTDNALFRQNFETSDEWTFDPLVRTQSYISRGMEYGNMIKVSYPPDERGSPRITEKFNLGEADEEVTSATLSFDFKLHTKFEFVRGGKMHGLGGGTTTMGCASPIDPNGWSVRMMWRAEGLPELYIYHQDRADRCGDRWSPSNFFFKRGTWYRIDLQVKMNSSPSTADGSALLYVDGQKIVEVNGLRLSGNASVNIDKFLFYTFYGGADPTWAPSQTTYVYYDNFTVHRGLQVTGEEGTECEIFLEGIYDPVKEVCCDNACGECGGTLACDSLPGGASQCCTAVIENHGETCDTATTAPCAFNSIYG